jgi:hypothetical protein
MVYCIIKASQFFYSYHIISPAKIHELKIRRTYTFFAFCLDSSDFSVACDVRNDLLESIEPRLLVEVSVGLQGVGVAREGVVTAADLYQMLRP